MVEATDYGTFFASLKNAVASTELIDDVTKAGIYPNPVNDLMNIKSTLPIKSVKILSMTGSVVLSQFVYSLYGINVLVLSLARGGYIVLVEVENGTRSYKILKK